MNISNQINTIQKSFKIQADYFNSDKYHLSKEDYLAYMINRISPKTTDNVLEVAAGTCICSRALSKYVHHIASLDITADMLTAGKTESEKAGINNISFIKGLAEELPFLDNSFDIVISRLAFHHFADITKCFKEMKRVLKPNGKFVLIDMSAQNEELRENIDRIERMRDNSHTMVLSVKEMKDLFSSNAIDLKFQEKSIIPVSLEEWMNLTKTPEVIKDEIRREMMKDIDEKIQTGFSPYYKNDEIFFNHHWVFNLGIKSLNN